MQKKRNCKLIILDGKVRFSQKSIIDSANPIDFLSLIKYAEYVLTSSYHGLLFSIIFNKEFYASFANNISRAKSILTILGLQNRLIPPKDIIPSNVPIIDYKNVNNKLNILKQSSLNFLSEIK